MTKELAPCGTVSAYQRHLRRGEETCRPCRDAINARNPKSPYPPRTAECGTNSGASRHQRLGEEICEPCRLARNKYQREYKALHGQNNARDRRKAGDR